MEKEIERVEEGDIDHMLEHLQDEHAELVPVERTTVKKGDFVRRSTSKDLLTGSPFRRGGQRVHVEIGSGRMIDGFEEQLVGAEVGRRGGPRHVPRATTPVEELRGKEALFKVTVRRSRCGACPS